MWCWKVCDGWKIEPLEINLWKERERKKIHTDLSSASNEKEENCKGRVEERWETARANLLVGEISLPPLRLRLSGAAKSSDRGEIAATRAARDIFYS